MKSSDTDGAKFTGRDSLLKDDHYEMNIVIQPGHTRKFIFDHRDPIFSQREPNTHIKVSANCVVCEKDISKKDKKFCEFCGCRACEKCMHKKRRFGVGQGHEEGLEGSGMGEGKSKCEGGGGGVGIG